MATLTITVPNPLVPRIASALTERHGSLRQGGDTDAQFVQRVMAELIKREVIVIEEFAALRTIDGPARGARIAQRRTDLGGVV